MSEWAPVALVVLVGSLAGVALLFAATRAFAFLGSVVDKWRPTAEHRARQGHDHLGGGTICIAGPIAFLAWYDVEAIAAHISRDPQWMPIISMIFVLVLTPVVGIVSLLRWKNAQIVIRAPLMQAIDWLGRESPWLRVMSARMTPSFRPPGRVSFEVESGWIISDTNWVNVRAIYDEVAKAGVSVEPWIERGRQGKAAGK